MEMKLQKVVNSMLAMQRYPWEQGVCAQSLFEVCGCPDFVRAGTSAEAQAAFIMASAWKHLLQDDKA